MAYIKRDYKDSVFRHLFGSAERKSSALELYNALAGTQHTDPGEIEITTIDNFLFLGRRNDVSFLIGDEMVLLEHQSTHNPNMPLRGLQYFERVYSKHIAVNELDIYGKQLVDLPTPRFFVFYFGTSHRPEREVMRLSDSFNSGPGDLEVTATVLNCNEGNNTAIMGACRALKGYAHLLALARENRKGGRMVTRDAIEAAIDQCIADGYLVDYLTAHRAEVGDMLFTMEDEERAMRVHMKAIEREASEKGERIGLQKGMQKGEQIGLQKGEQIGIEKTRLEMLRNLMSSTGKSAQEAMEMTGIPEEERPAYAAQLGSPNQVA